jgi:signal transduction histidine kinase
MSEDELRFADEDPAEQETGNTEAWDLLVVDDDKSVHDVTRFALADFEFENRKLNIKSAYSSEEARRIMLEGGSTAVVLLDVVMETDNAGLDLVRWIRSDLSDEHVRIVLRTGQPGLAPEFSVVRDYDINDYKEKSDLTSSKLVTSVYSALRSYRDIMRIHEQSVSLSNALEAAQEANRTKNNFITNMSHEFRTPLNGIIGLSEMIATEVLGPIGNETYREYAWDILASGKHLHDLVDSVLTIAEETGKPENAPQTFNLRTLIDDLLSSSQDGEKDRLKGRNVSKTGKDKEAILMVADQDAVRSMLSNLLANAVQHNPPNCKVRISVRQTRNRGISISVIDDGVGIDSEIVRKLGEPFNTTGDAFLAGNRGLGLGLHATKKMIENHGGRIVITTAKDSGTTVRLEFPEGSIANSP